MDVNLSAMDKLPLITLLVLERANNHCYKKKDLWMITNLQENLTYYIKTIGIDDLCTACTNLQ